MDTHTITRQVTTRRATLPLLGLGCGGAGALAAERALARLAGVVHVYCNPLTEMAYVEFDPARLGLDDLRKAVEEAGIRAGVPSVR